MMILILSVYRVVQVGSVELQTYEGKVMVLLSTDKE